MTPRRRLTSAQREALWNTEAAKAREAGRGNLPICNICELPIQTGFEWHDSHNRYLPHALGGLSDGIAHARCNLRWNHIHDTPLVAKAKRIRQKNIGAFVSRSPMPFGRNDPRKRKMNGQIVNRRTGEPWRT